MTNLIIGWLALVKLMIAGLFIHIILIIFLPSRQVLAVSGVSGAEGILVLLHVFE